eukprot:gene22453-29568_t
MGNGATWQLVTGSDLEAGEGICFNYKDNMRDDYAFLRNAFPTLNHCTCSQICFNYKDNMRDDYAFLRNAICFNYKDNMRDDYAFLHYGFIPEEEYPPQMFLVDHHNFGSDLAIGSGGSVEEMEGEIERLEVIKKMMAKTAAKGRFENMDDSDPVVRDLLELQRRRKVALQYEIGRLSDELIVLELQEQHGKPEAQSVYEE